MPFGNLGNYITRYISKELLVLGVEVFAVAAIFGGTMVWQNMHRAAPLQQAVILATQSDAPVPSASITPIPTEITASPNVIPTSVPSPTTASSVTPAQAKNPKATPTQIQTVVHSAVPAPTPTITPTSYLIRPCSLANSDIERELFAQVNAQRIAAGLKSLKWDDTMAHVAREHSLDMAENNFFSHINLKGETPWARAAKYSTTVTAENIGKWTDDMDSLEKITGWTVSMWMASQEHKVNILGAFTETGVGVMCSTNGYYLTQVFR